jgi:hypothetical protein
MRAKAGAAEPPRASIWNLYIRSREDGSNLYAPCSTSRPRASGGRSRPAIARGLFPARAMEVVRMFDILYLAIGIAAFLILTLYVYACDKL